MRMSRILAVAAAIALSATHCPAQFTEGALRQQANPNVIQGLKANYAGDIKASTIYFEAAVKEDPANAYAHYLLARSLAKSRSYVDCERALEILLRAADLAGKDYFLLSKIYAQMLMMAPRYYDYADAITDNNVPDKLADACEHLEGADAAKGYVALAEYNLQDRWHPEDRRLEGRVKELIKKALDVWPFSPEAYAVDARRSYYSNSSYRIQDAVGALWKEHDLDGRVASDLNLVDYDLAAGHFDQAVSGYLDAYHDGGDAEKGRAFDGLIYGHAEWFGKDIPEEDEERFYMLVELMTRQRMADEPNYNDWPALLAALCENRSRYDEAVKYFEIAAGANHAFILELSNAQKKAGDIRAALATLNSYMAEFPGNSYAYSLRADLREQCGFPTDSVLADLNRLVALSPTVMNYKERAAFEASRGLHEEAIADYFAVLQQDDDDALTILQRGEQFQILGQKELAEADFNAAIRLSHRTEIEVVALARLGKVEDAVNEAMRAVKWTENHRMGNEDGRPSAYYTLACVYSIAQQPDKCLDALKKALKYGFSDFKQARTDYELEYIRTDSRFDSLLKEYEEKAKMNQSES